MSGFRDTFTKGDDNDSTLGYDDSASLYFGGCVILCILLGWSYKLVKDILYPQELVEFDAYLKRQKGSQEKRCCDCSQCVTWFKTKQQEMYSWKRRMFRFSTVVQLVVLAGLAAMFFWISHQLRHVAHIQVFDPFDILGISRSASMSDIRKAYRGLSRIHHPDRNQNDRASAARFILISKAYQALTDEVAKVNYIKYGNPDGPGALKIGIGLPNFLTNEKYHLVILMVFFILLLVVIPAIFLTYYHRQRNMLPCGVQMDSARFIAQNLKEGTRVQALPLLLVAAIECGQPSTTSFNDDVEMKPLLSEVHDGVKAKLLVKHAVKPVVLRNNYLILAHMRRLHDLLSPRLRKELETLLLASDGITQCMQELASMQNWSFTAQAVIDFRRRLVQGVELTGLNAAFLQIPHFTAETVAHCVKGKKAVKELRAYLSQDPADRRGLLMMTPEQIADVHAFCRCAPLLRLTAEAAVLGEEHIVEGDIVSLTVHVARENLQPHEQALFVHAPLFPAVRQESWWFLVLEKGTGNLISFKKSKNPARTFDETLQFVAPRKGKWAYQVLAMSDDYVGLDVTTEVHFQVLSESEVTRAVYVHPDDEALDDEPTLLEQMLGQGGDADEEEDVDDGHHTHQEHPADRAAVSTPSQKTD